MKLISKVSKKCWFVLKNCWFTLIFLYKGPCQLWSEIEIWNKNIIIRVHTIFSSLYSQNVTFHFYHNCSDSVQKLNCGRYACGRLFCMNGTFWDETINSMVVWYFLFFFVPNSTRERSQIKNWLNLGHCPNRGSDSESGCPNPYFDFKNLSKSTKIS